MQTKVISKATKVALDNERIKEQELKNIIGFCFSSDSETEQFASKCLRENKTRFAINRLQWFVELADFQKYDSVKTFFLVAMAETNIKLLDNRFEDYGNMSRDVETFFSKFSKQDQDELRKHFFQTDEFLNKKSFEFDTVVEILLNARHQVVHGKNHYNFRFHNGSDHLTNVISVEVGIKKTKQSIRCKLDITYKNFREIMIKNAVENIKIELMQSK